MSGAIYYAGGLKHEVERIAPAGVIVQLKPGRCDRCGEGVFFFPVSLSEVQAVADACRRPLLVVCPACLDAVKASEPDAVEVEVVNPDLRAAMARHIAASN
jgi:hypothetical protein